MITLETAKKLKEAGFPQKNKEYYYYQSYNNKDIAWLSHHSLQDKCDAIEVYRDGLYDEPIKLYAVPTLEELLAEMPDTIGNIYKFHLIKLSDKYITTYLDKNFNAWKFEYESQRTDPSEAVANLWLKLKQEGLVK